MTAPDATVTLGVQVLVLYDRPKDHPDEFVMRRWDLFGDSLIPREIVAIAATLSGLRAMVPAGLSRVLPDPGDDPVIVEMYL